MLLKLTLINTQNYYDGGNWDISLPKSHKSWKRLSLRNITPIELGGLFLVIQNFQTGDEVLGQRMRYNLNEGNVFLDDKHRVKGQANRQSSGSIIMSG